MRLVFIQNDDGGQEAINPDAVSCVLCRDDGGTGCYVCMSDGARFFTPEDHLIVCSRLAGVAMSYPNTTMQ